MDFEFRVVVEKVSVANQKVVKRDTVKIYDIEPPKSILDLGLRHKEQISLLAKVQNSLLAEQTSLIELGYDTCPTCGEKIGKNGFMQSQFHTVFSDHKLRYHFTKFRLQTGHPKGTPTPSKIARRLWLTPPTALSPSAVVAQLIQRLAMEMHP